MTEARIELPPLPEPFVETDAKVRGEWAQCVLYTAAQMREYARAAVLQERERCARIAEDAGNQEGFRLHLSVKMAAAIRNGE